MADISHEQLDEEIWQARNEPEKFLELTNSYVARNPADPYGYFRRHHAFDHLGCPDLSLDDIGRAIEMEDRPGFRLSRAGLLMRLGRLAEALVDLMRGDEMDSDHRLKDRLAVYLSDCHAGLGDEETAMEHWARIEDTFYSPGFDRTPRGFKAEIEAELRKRAAAARAAKS